jgi:hypothetical protein
LSEAVTPSGTGRLIRESEGADYDEGEVVVDPYRFARVTVP